MSDPPEAGPKHESNANNGPERGCAENTRIQNLKHIVHSLLVFPLLCCLVVEACAIKFHSLFFWLTVSSSNLSKCTVCAEFVSEDKVYVYREVSVVSVVCKRHRSLFMLRLNYF